MSSGVLSLFVLAFLFQPSIGESRLFVFRCVSMNQQSTFEERKMRMKHMISGSILGMLLLFGTLGFAQQGGGKVPPPQQNVGKRHPNLEAAQKHLDMAWEKIQAAQQANEFDLGGHAAKAKDLIDQADKEIKEAARAANQEHK
jgi:hypothetical protein